MADKRRVTIKKDILQTNTFDGYFKYFFKMLGQYQTDKETWSALELIRDHNNLPEKYSSYESFKVAKHRYMRKMNKKGTKIEENDNQVINDNQK